MEKELQTVADFCVVFEETKQTKMHSIEKLCSSKEDRLDTIDNYNNAIKLAKYF